MTGGAIPQTVFEIIDNTDRNSIEFESVNHRAMYCKIITCEENSNQYKPFEIEGIPLDSSWLERAGFDKNRRKEISTIDDIQIELITPGSSIDFIEVYLRWDYVRHYLTNKVQYVHQLQNLYFALTGKELEFRK